MKQQASVLVVVLGLLAILAVIGVTFLTLSSLERATATSFALQTQMMIAADGALDYGVHQMVIDVWEWRIKPVVNTPGKFEFTGNLLTGRVAGATDPLNPTWIYGACETYDYPSPADDPWLSTPIVSNATPTWISFGQMGGATANRFGIKFGTLVTGPDNLGFPDAAEANGIWIPDLVAPCDQYLVRASVTILDHNALVNLNAHGNKNTAEWEYGDCIGKGYFVSDVLPGADLNTLLTGTGSVPGCWGADAKPGNPKAGAVLIENPSDPLTGATDIPYTLDEEFELRNLWGTYFKSRLEQVWPALLSDPSTASASGYARRLKTTNVSWTAEVRGDPAGSHATMKDAAYTDFGWSTAKADLNTATETDIYEALRDGRAWEDTGELKQLVANIVAFRRIKTAWQYKSIYVGDDLYIGAARQPILSEATCRLTKEETDPTDPDKKIRTYTVKVEVYNPWPGDYDGHTGGLKTYSMRVVFDVPTSDGSVSPSTYYDLPWVMAGDTCLPFIERQVVCKNNLTLKDALRSIKLQYYPNPPSDKYGGKALIFDIITGGVAGNDVATLETAGRIYRNVDFVDERRGTKNNSPIRVFYVSDWNSGGDNETPNQPQKLPSLRGSCIPIRFPNCVPENQTAALPVRAPAGTPYKAFARVGDLDQVLRFPPGDDTNWWSVPWIVTVSKTSRTNESNVKFDWMKNITGLDTPGAVAAARAANLFSTGGPWNDGIDNDGDGKTDFDDTGTPGAGRTGGPECRVAGKINLNTAIAETLTALGISAPAKPIKSPARVIPSSDTPNGIEVRDEVFSLISNIATVRSDTFSIYGTVQIVDPSRAKKETNKTIDKPEDIIRTRRFWALVDRSPSLAYPPTDKANFIYPRILNFQWLD